MSEPTIAYASECIEQLLAVLDNAYWEANTIEKKDVLYSILSALHAERSELSKLSIQDHDLEYEAICREFKEVKGGLNNLRKAMDDHVVRIKTSLELDRLISEVVALIN